MFKLRSKQSSALLYLTHPNYWHIPDIAYGGSAECGKSYVAAAWLISMCIDENNPDLYYAACAYDITKSEQSIKDKINEVSKDMGLKKDVDYTYNIKQHTFTFTKTGSRILLFGLNKRSSDVNNDWLRGYEFTGAWIDESDMVPLDVITSFSNRVGRFNNLETVPEKKMTDQEKLEHPSYKQYGGYNKVLVPKKILQTFNPTRKHPYEKFYLPWRDSLEKDTKFIRAFMNDNYSPEHPRFKEWLAKPDSREKEVMFYGNFEAAASDSAVFDYPMVDGMFNEDNKDGVMSAVVDIATIDGGDNNDSTTIGIFDGLNNVHTEEITGKKFTEDYIKLIKNIMVKWNVPNENIVFDANTLGSFISSSNQFKGCHAFKAHNSPIKSSTGLSNVFIGNENKVMEKLDSPYFKLRDQCVVVLAEKIRQKEFSSSIKDKDMIEKIKTELMMYERSQSPNGRLKVTSKKEIRANLKRSTDLSDLYVMRMYLMLLGETIKKVKPLSERKFYNTLTTRPSYE